MKATVMYGGKEVEIELTDEQEAIVKDSELGIFERRNKEVRYFFVGSSGEIDAESEVGHYIDNGRYNVANYCADETIMQRRAEHETLYRLLWRYAMTHGGVPAADADKYFMIAPSGCAADMITIIVGVVRFATREAAKGAYEEIVKPFLEQHPDFAW